MSIWLATLGGLSPREQSDEPPRMHVPKALTRFSTKCLAGFTAESLSQAPL